MTKRINYFTASPKAIEILLKQETFLKQQFIQSETLTQTIWELIKLRVSQINQCAFCIDMHSKDAIHLGEKPERIFGLNAWRDMPFYSEQEQDALAWAELLTAGKTITDSHYQSALDRFGNQGLVDLTVAVNAINSWNRIAKVFKPEVGPYQPSE